MNPTTYLTKPREVQVMGPVTGENMEEIMAWCGGLRRRDNKGFWIGTSSSDHPPVVWIGDYVVKDEESAYSLGGFLVETASELAENYGES